MFARLMLYALACLVSPCAPAACPTEGDPGWEPDLYSIGKEFRRAKYVVRAKSLRETWLGEDGKPAWPTQPFNAGGLNPLGMDPFLGAVYELEVLEVFKGAPQRLLQIFSSNTTARVPLPVNGEYLLFIQEYKEPGVDEAGLRIWVDHCGNSAEMPFAQATLQATQVLASKKK